MTPLLETFSIFSSVISAFAREYYLDPERRITFLAPFEMCQNLTKFDLHRDGGMDYDDIEALIGYIDDAMKNAYRWDIDLETNDFKENPNLGDLYQTCYQKLENWSAMNAVY